MNAVLPPGDTIIRHGATRVLFYEISVSLGVLHEPGVVSLFNLGPDKCFRPFDPFYAEDISFDQLIQHFTVP